MGNVIGTGTARNLVDSDGDPVDDGDGYLKVKLATTPSIDIGDVQLLAGASSGDLVIGTVKVQSLDTTPATFNSVTTIEISAASNTSWHTFSSQASKEVQIQSSSANVDTIYLSSDGDEAIGIELLPSTSISFPISNLNLLEYKLSAGTAGQKIYVMVLS